jgi:hypothetical protein
MNTDDRNDSADRFTAAAGVAQNSPMAEEAQQQVPEADAAGKYRDGVLPAVT